MEITLDTSAIAGAVSFAAGVLTTVAVAWTRVVRPIQRIAEDWRGEPARPEDGIPERPGVMLRLARLEKSTAAAWVELHPNGGSSMKDTLNRVDANLAAHVAAHVGAPVMLSAAPPLTANDGTHGHGTGAAAA